jgi:fibronectin-binding autotransporter adhesin
MRRFMLAAAVVAALSPSTRAADITWITPGNGAWGTAANWSGGVPGVGDVGVFSQTDGNTVATLSANTAVGGLRVTNTGSTSFESNGSSRYFLTLGGSGLTVEAGAGNVTIGSNVSSNQRVGLIIGADQTWTNNSTSLVFKEQGAMPGTAQPTNLQTFELTLGGSGEYQFRGTITGTNGGRIVVATPGLVRLEGSNLYDGGTTISSGTLQLGQTTGGNNGDAGSGPIVNNATLLISRNGAPVFANAISGSGNLVVAAGSNTNVTLTGTNTYGGSTTVRAGASLSVASPASLPGWNTAGQVDVEPGAALTVGSGFSDAQITSLLGTGALQNGSTIGFDTAASSFGYDGEVAGGIGLAKFSSNQLSLGGSNAYTGPTNVLAGTLLFTAEAAVSPATTFNVVSGATLAVRETVTDATVATVLSGTFAAGSTFGFDVLSGTRTYGGTIAGPQGLVKTGGGTLVLTASNAFSGPTTVSAGTLRLEDSSALGTSTGVALGQNNTIELAGGVTIPQSITSFTGGAVLRNLSGTNTWAGNLAIGTGGGTTNARSTSGRLILSGTLAYGSATGTRNFSLGENGDFEFAGVMDPGKADALFNMNKGGDGTLFVTGTIGSVLASGTTRLNVISGTAIVTPTASLFGAGSVDVGSGGTLGGTGTVGKPTSVLGTHSPGTSPGLQAFTAGLEYGSTATLVWELLGNTESGRGTNYDGVDVTTAGSLAIHPAATVSLVFDATTSTVAWGDAFWSVDREWLAIGVSGGSSWDGGLFGTVSVSDDAANQSLASVRPQASFGLTARGDGLYVVYQAVPEPSAAWLLMAGVLGAAGLRSRRRRR